MVSGAERKISWSLLVGVVSAVVVVAFGIGVVGSEGALLAVPSSARDKLDVFDAADAIPSCISSKLAS